MLVWGIGGGISTLVEEGNISAIQAFIGTIAFMLSLMLMMLFCIYINAYTLTMEKVKRSIESLLCTPLSLKQICLGKTLALFLPSLILGWLFTFGGIAGINRFFIAPELGQFIMPGAAPLAAILVVVPIIVLFLSLLVIILQLIIANIRWVNTALMGAIFAVGFGLSPVLMFGPASWSIVFVSLGVAAILAVIAFLLSPRVTKERIVLSSKG
jgi:ABC-2 type transport system permease protein